LIILDFETNSANVHDVIEVAAFRIKREEGAYVIADTFHRYYFSK
jgi:DNA polymerase-3 subunit epsilon